MDTVTVNPAAEDDNGAMLSKSLGLDVSPASDLKDRKRPQLKPLDLDDESRKKKRNHQKKKRRRRGGEIEDQREGTLEGVTATEDNQRRRVLPTAPLTPSAVRSNTNPSRRSVQVDEKSLVHPRLKALLDRLEQIQKHLYSDPTHAIMLKGAAVCLFGGKFFFTAAVVETMRKWYYPHPSASACVQALSKALKTETTAAEDFSDQYDEARRSWLTRKLTALLVLASPEQVKMLAVDAFKAALLISAVLRSQLIRVLVLGSIIGMEAPQFLSPNAKAKLEAAFPTSYRKWFPLAFSSGTKIIGCAVASALYSYLGPLITALRGAKMFASGFRDWCKKHDQGHVLEGGAYDAFVWGVLLFGLYVQLFVWPTLPLPLNANASSSVRRVVSEHVFCLRSKEHALSPL